MLVQEPSVRYWVGEEWGDYEEKSERHLRCRIYNVPGRHDISEREALFQKCGTCAKAVLQELMDGEVGEGEDRREKLLQVGQVSVNKHEPFLVLRYGVDQERVSFLKGLPFWGGRWIINDLRI